MRAVLQRVTESSVTVSEAIIGEIKEGLLILLGVGPEDTVEDVRLLAEKIVNLRIFCDEQDKMNLSLLDIGGQMLVVSNFTLYADCRKGRRPNFMGAAEPALANALYKEFCAAVREMGVAKVATGEFGGDMQVRLLNDGPITVILDSDDLKRSRRSKA